MTSTVSAGAGPTHTALYHLSGQQACVAAAATANVTLNPAANSFPGALQYQFK